ncbi:hypothetical protein GUJ93_ZPchr0499g26854 [Zizania palustris]|uniref:Uncharacterized protein n=1 Tax=Zizania palustris TaxID=103762 RepID=A0A8J5R296_ZIZPA|nr:hypothetical protein GUJ93_ZPchr0499g26854 [Zizania palustris]
MQHITFPRKAIPTTLNPVSHKTLGNEGFGPNSTGIIPAWLPVELGYCTGVSLLPLHSVVAASRLTSWLSTMSQSCCALSQGILYRTSPGL